VDQDDHVCVCHRVSLRKLVHYMNRTRPTVPSQLSDCLGAGTGCHWCVPFLRKLHDQWQRGETPQLKVSPESYAKRRAEFQKTGSRDEA
jgi:bacterioferritin-associated ferredoxin